MEKEKLNRVSQVARFKGMILFRGIVRALFGAISLGLIVSSACFMVTIANQDGYMAVLYFCLAYVTLATGISLIYSIGKSEIEHKK